MMALNVENQLARLKKLTPLKPLFSDFALNKAYNRFPQEPSTLHPTLETIRTPKNVIPKPPSNNSHSNLTSMLSHHLLNALSATSRIINLINAHSDAQQT